jgi:hypothetical protein
MPQARSLKKHIAGVALAVLTLATMPQAKSEEVNMFDGQWHASVTPYLWLPTVFNSTSFNGPLGTPRQVNINVTPNDYLSDLKFAAMITGEVRKGDWSVFTDYIYLDFTGQNSRVKTVTGPAGLVSDTIDLGSSASLRADVWTLAASYTAWRTDAGHLDVLAGTRYLGVNTSADWHVAGTLGVLPERRGYISSKIGDWDAIVGVKGELRLGSEGKWFMPYYLDVGGGSGNTTWQALIGAGYRYGWGAVTLSVRSLWYDFNGKTDDIRFTGPALGATFTF